MNINITARKTSIKDSFRDRVEKKLSKFDRFFDDNAQASVIVTNERERETVEVTVQSRGMLFRAEKTTDDRLDSLEAVVDSLLKQIIKNKTKLEKKGKTKPVSVLEGYEDVAVDDDYHVVRNKKFMIKPMNVDEAILQMNMLDHQFYMFRSDETGEISVVYKRNDGDYGLLEPEQI